MIFESVHPPGRTLVGLAVVGALAGALFGCDGRAREIRSGLSASERVRFDRGRELSTPCWNCHDFYGVQHKIGPHLEGIYGRRAGAADFGGYTDAMLATGILWNDDTLARFLSNVQGYVPGTTMVSPSIRSPADLDALLFYMRLVTRPQSN